ncbi:hypothetical protein ABTZ99_36840 [Actinosynnema sp. NPDC002837]
MLLRRAARTIVAWTAAVCAVVALTTAPSATASTTAAPRAMVPDGVYGITFGGDEDAHLTPLSSQQGAPTVLLPPIGLPGYQEWELVRDSRTTQLIRNLGTGLYLTPGEGQPADHRAVVAGPYPYSWVVRTGSAPNRVTIATWNGGFALDLSPKMIYPPRVDVQTRRSDLSQEWVLALHE